MQEIKEFVDSNFFYIAAMSLLLAMVVGLAEGFRVKKAEYKEHYKKILAFRTVGPVLLMSIFIALLSLAF